MTGKVAGLCKQISGVMSKYPFNLAKGAAEATIPEINSVLKPKEGAIWAFVDQNLVKFITRQGPQYVQIPGSGANINPAYLSWINRIAAFSDAAYAEGTQDPRL